jgi:hypothetical protein
MIEIQRPEQFTKAAERAKAERMKVRRHGRNIVEVTNESKGHVYHVLFERRLGKTFGLCSCEAGTPTRGHNRVPLVCKHLFAAVMFKRSLRHLARAA